MVTTAPGVGSLSSLLLSFIAFASAATITINPSPESTSNPFMAASSLAVQYSLTTSTSIPFPTQTLANSNAQSLLVSQWSLSKGRVQNGASNIAFVADPFPNSSPGNDSGTPNPSDPVLQVTYTKGGFGPDSGTQIYSLWNSSTPFQSMLLTYEVAFDQDFPFVLGGKLPGLRGGADPNTCSGGSETNGQCFSTRIMWRKKAAGEAYAYMLEPHNLCKNSNIICNNDFGISVERGSFTFAAGEWNRVTLLVRLNSDPNTANGQIAVYYNDVPAFSEPNLQFSNTSGLSIGGLYFSTFYGGDDTSWAPPADTHAYFRGIELWGSSAPSNLTASSASPSLSFSWLTASSLLFIHLVHWLGIF